MRRRREPRLRLSECTAESPTTRGGGGGGDIPVGDLSRLPVSGAGQGQGTEAKLGIHRASFPNDVSSLPRDDTSILFFFTRHSALVISRHPPPPLVLSSTSGSGAEAQQVLRK
ncbi:hypothetical protein CGRA01v4_05366 [Colletotrichum graminicola]|nr:hypothetical protein CGRA01v4_05366 [Colletotrichum graminicola]